MVKAAQGLIKGQDPDISDNPDQVIDEFKKRFCDTKLFYDPFARDKFAKYIFRAHHADRSQYTTEQVRQHIEEAQLFIEAAYSCNVRMSME